ncbi:cobalamin B12-binding domain-containing protein [Streptomyces sp. NBC_01306]|uniref:cobalamin B12-binding domain-containing protein n=1 Tax=Streptomyces sp. NBC_01306 TaxID=2903819 RepID=UPI00225312DF|nr:cobalamin-dependent protein [Streptomyces sp. NBC_01306]MCX4725051.1 cobalamin-dependent protein [Streptomyces sp. NBC_01306]
MVTAGTPGSLRRPGPSGERARLRVLVSGTVSDAHTWNLVFLQLLLEEAGHRVTNIGACVPEELLVGQCLQHRPDLVVISSVNGHGHQDGTRAVRALRAEHALRGTAVVIGGKLGISAGLKDDAHDALLAVGFDAVFDDSAGSVPAFQTFVRALSVCALPVQVAR